MPAETKRASEARGKHCGSVADRDHAVRHCVGARRDDRFHRPVLIVKTNRNRLIPPRIVQTIAPIAHKHQPYAQLPGGFTERPDLIPDRRGHEQNAFFHSEGFHRFGAAVPRFADDGYGRDRMWAVASQSAGPPVPVQGGRSRRTFRLASPHLSISRCA